MVNELEKVKYNDLYNKLNTIKNKLHNLNEVYSKLYFSLEKGLTIDDMIYDEQELVNVNIINNQILNELETTLIPLVKSKMQI